ncbi:MAG: hypothetical protein Q9162_004703 [Coniocarpon cinnabarinum]
MALVAQRSNLLESLREFVKIDRKPTWGTCAGLILLAEAANHTKKGGQELIGGLDVRVNRNHFGRQVESFETDLELSFLNDLPAGMGQTARFHGIFIRAPVVEKVMKTTKGIQEAESKEVDTVVAPSLDPRGGRAAQNVGVEVDVVGVLPGRADALKRQAFVPQSCEGDIIAVRQGNCFGTSFHPELTNDERIHIWWLLQVEASYGESG